jgi:hypothetical protein
MTNCQTQQLGAILDSPRNAKLVLPKIVFRCLAPSLAFVAPLTDDDLCSYGDRAFSFAVEFKKFQGWY